MSTVRRMPASGLREKLLASLGLCFVASFALVPQAQEPPPPPPVAWRGLIGEYGSDTLTRVMILERDGHLVARFDSVRSRTLEPTGGGAFRMDRGPTGAVVHFRVGAGGRATAILLGDTVVKRRALGPEEGSVFRVVPVRPVAELRHEALAASPRPCTSTNDMTVSISVLARLFGSARQHGAWVQSVAARASA